MSGPSGGAAYRGAVSHDEAASLILNDVKVDRRAALVSAFADRIVIVTHLGTRAIPTSSIARINHKAGLRTGRISITTVDGEQVVVRGLRSRDTPTAYQVLVRIAQAAT